MIVPMKKVCLMVQDKTKNEALVKLRGIGVVHLENAGMPADRNSSVVECKKKLDSALGLISEIKTPKNKNQLSVTQSTGEKELPDLIIGIDKDRKALQDRVSFISREISRIEAWGDFQPDSIKEMAALGLPVFLYELSSDFLSAIPQDIRYMKLGGNKNTARIIVLDNELPGYLLPGVTPFQLPEKSLSDFSQEAEGIKISLNELDKKLVSLAEHRSGLISEMAVIEREIEFENAAAGMEKVQDVPVEYGLSWLTGYVPVEDLGNLKAAACENGWALTADDPEDADEAVPTKLRNNKFVNLLNPLTNFLGIVPGYREVDISLWFLFFFCIYFGMIFGDAVYGIFLSLIAIIGIVKTAKKGIPQALRMLLLLGIFNTAWGVLTCSWLGVDVEMVPQFLQNISLSVFSTAKTDAAIVDQNLQIFCFSLGLLHLSIAHIIGLIRNIKSLKALAEIGAIGMLCGMFNVVLFLVVSNDTRSIPLMPVSIHLLVGGFVLSFIFAYYEGSLGQSVLSSCKNIISVVLGVANVFSDVMSYIRLWAVGLAGASIAATVNIMAGPMLGNFLIFAGILLLVFGHGINIVLNVLSVLVHGVRLNTLEFSGHVGLTWSGTAYRPFAERVVK